MNGGHNITVSFGGLFSSSTKISTASWMPSVKNLFIFQLPATIFLRMGYSSFFILYLSLSSKISFHIFLSGASLVMPLRCITRSPVSVAFCKLYVENPCPPPHEKEGIKFLGKPAPKIFAEKPTTVPVLNIVLMPHL